MLQGAKNSYSSRSYGKMRFIQERQKQSFTDKLINKFVKTCQKNAGYDYFVVAYGDGNFGLTMKGMDGGRIAHRRLMAWL
jgi:hypothetical protein